MEHCKGGDGTLRGAQGRSWSSYGAVVVVGFKGKGIDECNRADICECDRKSTC